MIFVSFNWTYRIYLNTLKIQEKQCSRLYTTDASCGLSLQRAQSELAAHQKKILHVDNHIGISIAGLTADARLLW